MFVFFSSVVQIVVRGANSCLLGLSGPDLIRTRNDSAPVSGVKFCGDCVVMKGPWDNWAPWGWRWFRRRRRCWWRCLSVTDDSPRAHVARFREPAYQHSSTRILLRHRVRASIRTVLLHVYVVHPTVAAASIRRIIWTMTTVSYCCHVIVLLEVRL